MLARTPLAFVAVSLLMIAATGCAASGEIVNGPDDNGTGNPAPPAKTLSVNENDAPQGIAATPPAEGFKDAVGSPDTNGPKCNVMVAQAGSTIPVRVAHEDPTPLIREAIPNKTFVLVHAELYTDRGIGSQTLPLSTVVIRDSLFQEALFDKEMSRTSGRIDDSPEGITTVHLTCASTGVANEAPDTIYYSKIEGELVLERVTPQGVQRRFYR